MKVSSDEPTMLRRPIFCCLASTAPTGAEDGDVMSLESGSKGSEGAVEATEVILNSQLKSGRR